MVDQGSDLGRGTTGGVHTDARRAGFDDTPEPVRTAIVEHGMTPAPLTGRRNSQRQLLGDDVDEMPELVAGHGRSRSRIFERRRMYLGSRIAASSQAATIMRACSTVTRLAPSVRTLAPLCSRA